MLPRALTLLIAGLSPALAGGNATGGIYAITQQSLDPIAGTAASASYQQTGGIAAGPVRTAVSNLTQRKNYPGFAGQLYEVISVSIDALPASLPEQAELQLTGHLTLDDGTTVHSRSPGFWQISSGPLSVTQEGALAAAAVYQDTVATVALSAGNLSAQAQITVSNVNGDDLGIYGADGIDDAWQVQWFGLANPLGTASADASGTGQNNLFKWLAGLDPRDPWSRFRVAAELRNEGGVRISFGPCLAGRSYTVLRSADLVQWTAVPGGTVSGEGASLSFIDPSPAPKSRYYYRVEVGFTP
jgi:hypothetical protein